MSADGIVEVYAKTEDYQFPLVLVIGRAANNEDNRLEKEGVGTYDFRKHTQTDFWLSSFSVYGQANNIELTKPAKNMAAAVKNIFEKRSCSPVVFSDATPQGLPFKGKQDYSGLSDSEISAHINNIFSLKSIIKRVVLVVLSGHDLDEKLGVASKLIKEKCGECKIQNVVETMYMTRINQPKNIEKLKKENVFPMLQEVHTKFLEETAKASS